MFRTPTASKKMLPIFAILLGSTVILGSCKSRSHNDTGLRSETDEQLQGALSILKTNPLERLVENKDLLTKLATATSKVSPDERNQIIEKAKSMIGSQASKQKLLRVVFDADEWKRYVGVCAKDGLPQVDGFTELSLLPDDLRDTIIATVKETYATASKGDHSWKSTIVAPKRCLDAILSYAVNPLKIISTHEKVKTDLTAAYDSYLAVFREIIFPDGSRGNYSAQQVFDVARIFQQFLKEEKNKRPIASQYTIYMGGSYVNGRAKLESSDVDIVTVDMSRNPILAAHQMFSPLALTDAVRKRVTQDYPPTQKIDLKVQIDNLFFNLSSGPAAEGPDMESKFSRFMPVMIAVRADEIKLEVFSAFEERPPRMKAAFSEKIPNQ
ncbi:MAG: hypothetical protein FJY29_03720 [Betaproteobacteria bacterium]|nr:hypothetical protein [Betaproteobacteria bacterium]